ncbi:hypothetical protein [Sulfitobacter guttiformis]|uniref:Orotidine 5-phosphate decarboxylase n=1 Tax=Sulfitobacter guttiformis TaxID=74349 RepID=A0A420DTB2_9RHOB|nr:hypothetical protein [Sulfitobacter guttiformis]RKE97379.1 hypothetical protein C8N30_1978 [Sulfitobacter guttiformis]
MTNTFIELNNVVYNAATQCFEALVTVETDTTTKTYPCAIEAPMSMSFEQAALGLQEQAVRRSKKATGMYSQMRHHVAPARAGRPRFDARTWLANLGFGSFNEAA